MMNFNTVYTNIKEENRVDFDQVKNLISSNLNNISVDNVELEQYRETNWGYSELKIKFNNEVFTFNNIDELKENFEKYVQTYEKEMEKQNERCFHLKNSDTFFLFNKKEKTVTLNIGNFSQNFNYEVRRLPKVGGDNLNRFYHYPVTINGDSEEFRLVNPKWQDMHLLLDERAVINKLLNKIDNHMCMEDYNGLTDLEDIGEFAHSFGYDDFTQLKEVIKYIKNDAEPLAELSLTEDQKEVFREVIGNGFSGVTSFMELIEETDSLSSKCSVDDYVRDNEVIYETSTSSELK